MKDISYEWLEHYGIKGQKWGVVNKDEPTGKKSSKKTEPSKKSSESKKTITEEYKKIEYPKISKKQEVKNRLDNEQKAIDKLGPPQSEKHGLSSKQKKALAYTAIGAIAVGGILYASKKGSSPKFSGSNLEQFEQQVVHAKKKTWGGKPITSKSFDRPEFELPAGHTFHRLSMNPETSFTGPTYATHNIEDAKRYVVSHGKAYGGKNLHNVTWKSNEAIKVPNLTTVLETVRENIEAETGKPASKFQVHHAYTQMSGTGWQGPKEVKLLESLRKKGYGAIVDELDAGVIGESPIVLFATEKMGSKSAAAITKEAMDKTFKEVLPLINPKP